MTLIEHEIPAAELREGDELVGFGKIGTIIRPTPPAVVMEVRRASDNEVRYMGIKATVAITERID